MTRKMAVVGFSYLIGLFIASYFAFGVDIFIGLTAVIVGVILYFILRKFDKVAYAVSAITIGISFLVFGLYSHFVYDKVMLLENADFTYTEATVLDISYDSSGSTKYICKSKNLDKNFKFVLYYDDTDFDYETEICAELNFKEYSSNAYFSSKEYNKTNGIYLYATIKNLVSVSENKNIFYYIKTYSAFVTEKINENLDEDSAAILNAMFTGDKTNYTAELKSQMYRCGIGHILAISGFHFSVLVGLLMLILKHKNKYVIIPVLLILCLMYCLFTGCTMSSLRAVIMIIIVYSGRLINRKADMLNSLGIAAFVLVVFSPFAAKNISLLLSLCGTFGITVVGDYVNDYLTKKFKVEKPSKIRTAIVSSYCAFLCTAPISIYVFNGISTVGALLLLVITPFCIVSMYSAFVYAALGCVFTPLIKLSGLSVKAILLITGEVSKLDFIYVYFTDARLYALLALLVLAVILVYLISKNATKTLVSVLISICILFSSSFVFKIIDKTEYKIAFLSDRYDGTVIVYTEDCADLIISSNNDYSPNNIEDFLIENGIEKIDSIVFSDIKPDKYEIYNGLAEKYKVRNISLPSGDYDDIINNGLFSNIYISTLKPVAFKTGKCYNINVRGDSVEVYSNGFSMFIGNEPKYTYSVVAITAKTPNNFDDYNADMVVNLRNADFDNRIINVYKDKRFILTVDNNGKFTKRSYGYAFYG